MGDVARETGARDLRCPTEQVRADRMGPWLSPHYLAIGCGHYVKYVCYSLRNTQIFCVPDQPVLLRDVHELGPDAGVI